MSSFEDNRWLQRFQSFRRALTHLDQAIIIAKTKGIDNFSDIEKQGTIKCFEMVFDLAWKTLQDYLKEQGYGYGAGPKATIRQAFKDDLIKDGDEWIEMLDNRNNAAHTYDEDLADGILEKIQTIYYRLFNDLDIVLTQIKNNG